MKALPPLNPDEEILWQGRPDARLTFGMESMATGLFAAALILACLGMGTVVNRSVPGMFWPIFGPGLILGAVTFLGYPLFQSWQRRRTSYLLTNQRAFMITGRGMALSKAGSYSVPIPAADHIRLQDGTPGSVWFGRRRVSGHTGGQRNMINVGFDRITDAPAVFKLMQTHARAAA